MSAGVDYNVKNNRCRLKIFRAIQRSLSIILKQIELGNIKKHNMMFTNPDEKDIVQFFLDNRAQSKLPSYYVPSYDYFAVDDDKFIGVVHIRIRLTDNLLRYGGHIGYGVNPKYWKMGYGKELLKLPNLKEP